MNCPRCGHSVGDHWPAHEAPTTACVTCLNARNYTQDPARPEPAVGVCCYTVEFIERTPTPNP